MLRALFQGQDLERRQLQVDHAALSHSDDAIGAATLRAQVRNGVGSPNTYFHLYTYNDAANISSLSSSLMPSGQSIKW